MCMARKQAVGERDPGDFRREKMAKGLEWGHCMLEPYE